MARQQLGKTLSGGVIALCVVLLLTPMTYGQTTTGGRVKLTVSGKVGLSGVTIQGLPGAPVTDENGVYNAEVNYGTKLTIRPVKMGYTFEPSQITYEKVTEHKTDGDFIPHLVTFKISGSVGKPGVLMQGLPGNVVSDENGQYSAEVSYGFTDTVIPTLEGYRFEPSTTSYDQVKKPQVQNYTPVELNFTISGTVGAAGVEMTGFPGPQKVVSDKENRFTAQVPYNWAGTITPVKEGHQFTPEKMVYPPVTSSLTDEIFIAHVDMYKISGTTNLANVMLKGLPGNPISDTEGYYEVEVEHGWEGEVTPFRAGWEFQPPSITYTKVTSARENQNYNASEVQLTISGRAVAGAQMRGLPGNPTADSSGFYKAQVGYGWVGDITPVLDGYEFDPPSYAITSLTNDETNRNFRGKVITYTISGNVGSLKGVKLVGLPGAPVSDAQGNYSVQVQHRFNGTVRPTLAGYQFDPPTNEYVELTSSLTSENYRASIIQHELAGRIVAESGSAEGILIRADNNGGSTMTDANGDYKLLVDHGWQGTITPVKEGYTFNPPNRQYGQIFQPRSNIAFYGNVKMLTITDKIIFDDGPTPEPIEDVLITAEPDENGVVKPVKTGSDGKYRIQVPYGWSGELIPTKEGFFFNPPSTEYLLPVTEDIDKTVSKPVDRTTTTPPVDTTTTTPPVDTTTTTPPVDTTTTTPPVDTTTTTPPVDTTTTTPPVTNNAASRELEARRLQILKDLAAVNAQIGGTATTPVEDKPNVITTLPPIEPPVTKPAVNPLVSTLSLLDVLDWMEKKTNVKIERDITVKGDPVSVGFDLNGVTAETLSQALQNLLEGTGYMFRRQGNSYLVFRPISNEFLDDDLREALSNVSYAAGVAIIPDANVTGQVTGSYENYPLDTLLDALLAGSSFIVKKTPDYYVVYDKGINSDQFWKNSETRHIKLSYTTPQNVVTHLSKAFKDYVNANTDPNSRVISVTAPSVIVDRIVGDIRTLDSRPEHVILEARVVAMERNDLFNLGAEWGWPKMEIGAFDSSLTGDSIWAAALGYSADAAFTDSLLLTLNLLEQNEQADIIAKPVVTAQDGKTSTIAVMDEEYFLLTPQTASGYYTMSELVTITSGTKLQITPYIGDNNDITLEIATEVSESIPNAAATDLPVVTRRTSQNVTTVKDGGTVALAGLSRTHAKLIEKKVPGFSAIPLVGNLFKNTEKDETTQEVAIFVTASLVRDLPDRLSSSLQAEEPFKRQVAEPMSMPASGSIEQQIQDRLAAKYNR